MEPTGKIAPEFWLTAPETRAVVEALTADGAQVRFIGGCVRDAISKRPIKDIDIATPDAPERVMALLQSAGIKAIPTGIDHGTVTAVVGERHFEITTLRVDVETDGRRARVAFTDDWAVDASRRDLPSMQCRPLPKGTFTIHSAALMIWPMAGSGLSVLPGSGSKKMFSACFAFSVFSPPMEHRHRIRNRWPPAGKWRRA
ncbi:MAG: hypothetical protein OEY85_00075 [Rhodospirillales bacterium]|nr:hypothetical protein [Rhodospirillales bacterium]